MSKSLKEQWIKDRTEQLRTGPSTALVHLAEDNTIQIDDLMSRKDLARQIAEAEWAGRRGPRNFEELDRNFATASGLRDAVERAGLYVGPDKVLVDDIAPDGGFSPWGLDPETCGESGPTECINAEEEPPHVTLQRNIMNRWIGAVGGMDWYNGPTPNAEVARQHGKALAAALDGVFQDLQRPPRGLREPATSSGWFIYEVLLPEFLEQFLAKNADYGDQHRTGLGVRAEYVGDHRAWRSRDRPVGRARHERRGSARCCSTSSGALHRA
ncbi:MAG: hypothetical protein IPK85_03070 [Gemmatimonadetes bacterium]|nr:hypothetical protein [Gemmatimonadota bacterium]